MVSLIVTHICAKAAFTWITFMQWNSWQNNSHEHDKKEAKVKSQVGLLWSIAENRDLSPAWNDIKY